MGVGLAAASGGKNVAKLEAPGNNVSKSKMDDRPIVVSSRDTHDAATVEISSRRSGRERKVTAKMQEFKNSL